MSDVEGLKLETTAEERKIIKRSAKSNLYTLVESQQSSSVSGRTLALLRDHAALVAEVARLNAKVRPFSDALAQKTIEIQVAEIDRLHAEVARLNAERDYARTGHDSAITRIAQLTRRVDVLTGEVTARGTAPDRERLAERLDAHASRLNADNEHPGYLVLDLLEAASLLRLPAAGECEEMAKRLTDEANWAQGYVPAVAKLLSEAAALLRRMSPVTAGEWSIAKLQTEIGRLQQILHHRVLGDPRVGVGNLPSSPKEAGR